MKLPAFQFYPGDWMKCPGLRRCTHAVKGVWIDILCLMSECDERGILATNGTPWTDEEIALAVGGDKSATLEAILELTLKGVANRREDGALICRRMMREENKRKLCREAGKLGGNPNLRPTLKGAAKGADNGRPKGGPTPSTSTSTSTSDNTIPPASREGVGSALKPDSSIPDMGSFELSCATPPGPKPTNKREPTGHPEHSQLIKDWMERYAARNKGEKYPFQARDARAAKDLLAHFGTREAVNEFIAACQARSGTYPFGQVETLYDLANGIGRLIPALKGARNLGSHEPVDFSDGF